MKSTVKKLLTVSAAVGIGIAWSAGAFSAESLDDVMKRRGLTQKDLLAAAKDIHTDRRPRRIRRVLIGWPKRSDHRLRHPVDADSEICRRVHA